MVLGYRGNEGESCEEVTVSLCIQVAQAPKLQPAQDASSILCVSESQAPL